jgi:hypothetical protein
VLKKETCGTEQNRMVAPVLGGKWKRKNYGGRKD